MFDRVEIVVKAGYGGNGAVSFRHEKFVPFGGPDGGNGGEGGDAIIVAGEGVTTLRYFKQKRVYRAGDGGNGKGKKKQGKKGTDLLLTVPVGTVVSYKTQIGESAAIADLAQLGQQAMVARGGKGGFGNVHYVSSTNQAPRIAQKGEPRETYSIILELRLIADVGIIGYPNAGKSTLLAAASAAKPKIASYPFTTREPVLGVVEAGGQSFVLAEIPGLIEGAHLGRGLGHDFLRHALRTKMLIHLVDGSSLSPAENFAQINTELSLFDSALAQKPQLVAINKIDLPEVRVRLDTIRADFSGIGIPVHFISAETKEGVAELMAETAKMLQTINLKRQEQIEAVPAKVFRPQPRQAKISVHKEGNIFVVVAPEFERIITSPGARDSAEAQWYIKMALMRSRVGKALEKSGVKPGDKVRFGNVEWEW